LRRLNFPVFRVRLLAESLVLNRENLPAAPRFPGALKFQC
jgi:hypothetical protein